VQAPRHCLLHGFSVSAESWTVEAQKGVEVSFVAVVDHHPHRLEIDFAVVPLNIDSVVSDGQNGTCGALYWDEGVNTL